MKQGFVFKSVFRRMGRYGFLIAMIAVGVGAVILVQAVTVGMTANVTEGAARYLGGRYIVIARNGTGAAENRIENVDAFLASLAAEGLRPRLAVQREIAAEVEPTLFFNGSSFRVRRVSGVDFDNEDKIFEKLSFVSGGTKGLKGTKAILVSRQVAERFGLRRGDEVTLRLKNSSGYLDSTQLVVGGVFRDASIFGFYNVYVDIEVLKHLMGYPEGSCGTLGLYYGDESATGQIRRLNEAITKAGYEVFPSLHSRSELDAYRNESWSGTRYGILPIENYVDDKVMDLIHAIQIVSYLFLGMTLLVILVGMRNTTQIMIRKRFREIGTIRALGLTEAGTLRMVLSESLLVASLGFALGLAGAVVLLSGVQLLPFDWSDGFDIFLKRGHLGWRLSPLFLAVNYGALALMTAAGALPAARKAASISPAAAMATND